MAVFVPWIAGAIAGALAGLSRLFSTQIGGWIATAALALGITLVATEAAVEPMMDMAAGALGGMPAQAVQWLGVLNIDKYITIVISAYAAGGIKRAVLARRGAA